MTTYRQLFRDKDGKPARVGPDVPAMPKMHPYTGEPADSFVDMEETDETFERHNVVRAHFRGGDPVEFVKVGR